MSERRPTWERDHGTAVQLASMPSAQVLSALDLTMPELAPACAAAAAGDEEGAFAALIEHYRRRFPLTAAAAETVGDLGTADKIRRHVFQWGPYDEADYGDDLDWDWDPAGDIEWVAALQRFYWANALAAAYRQTRDEAYADAFVELTTDWIGKHRLEDRGRAHPVYTDWKGFVWLDIQTGIRATNLCAAFTTFVHSRACTPAFLQRLLASLHDHQEKTRLLPMGMVHNKAIFEQRGFVNVAWHFREFAAARSWLELAMARARESFLAQTTTDGVQREWSFGYHLGVLRDAVEIRQRVDDLGIEVPADYEERLRACCDYIFGVASPDLGAPMFGDASRPPVDIHAGERSTWQLHGALHEATRATGDGKYAARADLELDRLPAPSSQAWPEAGIYVLRDDWGPEAIHLTLHCSPPAISGHDQPDNGTFELYAFGRWLMPDSGFYTYGHDSESRAWHRQTRVHATLTLDDANSSDAGRHRLWHTGDTGDTLVVDNGSYPGLTHRRTLWFVDHRFFVLLDEAIGAAPGALDLHFPFAPGQVEVDREAGRARTRFADANVLVAVAEGMPVTLHEEAGWTGWSYGHRAERPALRLRHDGAAPAWFLSAVVPFRGAAAPEVDLRRLDGAGVGDPAGEVRLAVAGQAWSCGRDLASGQAWIRSDA